MPDSGVGSARAAELAAAAAAFAALADALLPGRVAEECCSNSSRARCSACSWAACSSAASIASVRAAMRRPPRLTRAARRETCSGDDDGFADEPAGIAAKGLVPLVAERSFDGEAAFGSGRVKT